MEEKDYVGRPFGPQDCEKMPALLKKVWKFESNADYWRWKYLNPPFKTEAMVVENENNEIIAFNGFWRRPVKFNNQILYPYLSVDTMVAPEYQRTGVSKFIISDFAKLLNEASLFGFTNEKSHKFFKMNLGSYIKVDAASPGYQAVFNIGTIVNAPKPISSTLNVISRGLHNTRFFFQNSTDIEVVKDEKIDEEFNALWEEISGEFLWIQKRDMDYLQWRYLQAPGSKYHIWKARENGKLVGYMVSNTTITPESKRAVIVDWFASLQRPEIFTALLGAACRWNLKQGVDVLEAWLLKYPAKWEKILRSHWFLIKRNPRTFLLTDYPQVDSEIGLYETLDPDHMMVALGDSDYLGWATLSDFQNMDRRH